MVKRNKKIAYYGVPNGDSFIFTRMTGFTKMSVEKNPKEYKRQYVDEEYEHSDIVSYATAIEYEFDRFLENDVHEDMINLTDSETVGTDAVRPIIIVDFTQANGSGYDAQKRDFSIIPSAEGSSLDAYTYSGSLKACGDIITGVASSADNFATVTFA